MGNRTGEAHTWDSLGFVHHQAGRDTEAIACYEQALRLFRELDDRFLQAAALRGLGDARRAVGHLDEAREGYRRALEILDELDHPDARDLRALLDATPDRPR